MDWGKYIIIEVRGIECAIVFDPLISHCDIGTKGDSRGKIVAAGMFEVGAEKSEYDSNDISVCVFGKSVTLELESRKGQDERLIKRVLRRDR